MPAIFCFRITSSKLSYLRRLRELESRLFELPAAFSLSIRLSPAVSDSESCPKNGSPCASISRSKIYAAMDADPESVANMHITITSEYPLSTRPCRAPMRSRRIDGPRFNAQPNIPTLSPTFPGELHIIPTKPQKMELKRDQNTPRANMAVYAKPAAELKPKVMNVGTKNARDIDMRTTRSCTVHVSTINPRTGATNAIAASGINIKLSAVLVSRLYFLCRMPEPTLYSGTRAV
mmetsp:Transcript_15432/g.29321  ORF Transcript_15432/g.29321 Transcript_15432/m.29321 type:complete len:234 (+) Transcript_15432:218-919(+)